MAEEQRVWKRFNVDVVAKYRLSDESSYEFVKISNIHHQGCRLKSDVELPRGQSLRIVILPSSADPIYLNGTVVWSKAVEGEDVYKVGVQFVIDSPYAEENSAKLYNYCATGSIEAL
jgi:hypothetical protein